MSKKEMVVPEGWRSEKFGRIVKRFQDGGTPKRANLDYFNGSIPWVVIEDICPLISKTFEYLTPKGLNSSSAKLFPAGSIILSFGATIGEVGVAGVSLTTKQGIAGIELSNGFDTRYVYQFLITQKGKLNSLAVGSTIREVRPDVIKDKVVIRYPIDLKEQQKIASILSELDQTIEKTERLIEKYERLKMGLMEDLFTKGIDLATGKPHTKFRDTEFGRVPEKWGILPLKDLVSSGRRITYGIVQPGDDVSPDGIPLIRGKDYSSGKVSTEGLYHVRHSVDKPYSRSKVIKDDILFSIVGYVGLTAVVPAELEGANITQTTARLSICRNKADWKYVHHFLGSVYIKSQIKHYTKGSAQPGLNLSDVEKINVLLPGTIQEQSKIASILSETDAKIEKERLYRDKLQSLKKGLMEDLLMGKVRVKLS